MLRIYYKKNTRLAKECNVEILKEIPIEDMVWIGLIYKTLRLRKKL